MKDRLLILAYHKIAEHPRGEGSASYVSPEVFERQVRWLMEKGWRVSNDLTAAGAVITFDDGYRNVLTSALPILKRLEAPAIMFVPTDFVGKTNTFDEGIEPVEEICTWDELAELAANGVEVQSHGAGHRFMSELDEAGRRHELVASRRAIEANLKKRVEIFSYPYGDDGGGVDALLHECGYKAACIYGGGAMPLPIEDRWHLQRLAMGPDTDLEAEVG